MLDILKRIGRSVWTYISLAITGILAAAGDDIYNAIVTPDVWSKLRGASTDVLTTSAKFSVKPFEIPMFVLATWSIVTCVATGLLIWKFWPKSNRVDWSRTISIINNFRSFSWRDLCWEWNYIGTSVQPPRPICPKCHADMLYEEFRHGEICLRVYCPNGDHQVDFDEIYPDFEVLRFNARREILRTIRQKAPVMEFY